NGVLALPGANIFWQGTTVGTISDVDGIFKLIVNQSSEFIIVSYAGYQSDTIKYEGQPDLNIVLASSLTLNEVEVVSRNKTTAIGYMSPIKMENIGEGELHKAACCNLSESFETNPSVDVSFTDAVTGTRQIQMLGLAGPYVQITRENIPDIRGLSAIYGFTYTPGAWVSSISLIKGTGSVVNGFESIAGQIDVNLWQPANMDRVYLNLFANQEGRMEANLNLKTDVGEKWRTGLLLHGKTNQNRHDNNGDGFMEAPLGTNLIALNRWEYKIKGGHVEIGVKGTLVDQLGGQMDYDKSHDKLSDQIWGMQNNTKRLEAWSKTGKVFENNPEQSFGLQLSGVYHDQTSYFGLKEYQATQKSFYGNYIFQSTINGSNHKYKVGASFIYDEYHEQLSDFVSDRIEYVPGLFVEYTYNWNDRLNVVAGLRGDYHNVFGFFMTPRLHLRYLLTEDLIVRVSAGRGQRTAQILSENIGILSSSRQLVVKGDGSNKPYGLNPEVAWNYGINLTWDFELDYRDGAISFDFYRTAFHNQIVVDLDSDVRKVSFYNLEGESFSNSFQAQLDYELIKRFDMRLAYRWYDVKTTYGEDLLAKPMVSTHRAFINLAYHTRNLWKFDATLNWQGEKRLPSTAANPIQYQRADYSPSFFMLNAQISKSWKKRFDIYLGVENLLDYKQTNPIVAADQPFGEFFDASMVWGPIFGRNMYIGLRYKLK
ncbi:MAG: TonB-dependent receptor, partial [Bacteroidales bacterium]|nr:TonB-dependent receptor [Bacteroidales bacterium]